MSTENSSEFVNLCKYFVIYFRCLIIWTSLLTLTKKKKMQGYETEVLFDYEILKKYSVQGLTK